jgi:SDR family mycofactocin-dependent oxidoreductase
LEQLVGRYDGKVAFITGGARGQGRSHALRLASEGADIAILDLAGQVDSVEYPMSTPADLEETEAAIKELGREVLAMQGDVRDEAQVVDAVDRAEERFGHLDVVLANAGILPSTGEPSQRIDAWHDTVATMLTGVFYTVRHTAPRMAATGRGGAVCITGSTSTYRGVAYKPEMLNPGQVGYGAAKHGVLAIMRNFAMVYGKDGVRVNVVIPAGVNTKMIDNEFFAGMSSDAPGGWMANVMEHGPVEPGEISNAVAFLCSDEARFITGQTLAVDMGTLLI